MIVGAGVLIPAELCRLVGELAAAEVRRDRITNPELLRVVEELLSVSAPVSESGQNVDTWEPVADAARRRGVEPRTVRRWAAAGKVPARKAGSAWLVQRTG